VQTLQRLLVSDAASLFPKILFGGSHLHQCGTLYVCLTVLPFVTIGRRKDMVFRRFIIPWDRVAKKGGQNTPYEMFI
jgi:hypothetical protein